MGLMALRIVAENGEPLAGNDIVMLILLGSAILTLLIWIGKK